MGIRNNNGKYFLYLLNTMMIDNILYIRAIDTYYMVTSQFEATNLVEMLNNNTRNFNIRNLKTSNYGYSIKNVIHEDKLIVLYRYDNNRYLVADNLCNLKLVRSEDIINNKHKFGNISIKNNKIVSLSGRIEYATKRIKSIYEMEEFNYKAQLMGLCTLRYDIEDFSDEVVIKGTYTDSETLIIPNAATSIGTNAFNTNYHIKNVQIGKGVTCIGVNAFYNCLRLESLKLGDNVDEICHGAFKMCTNLKKIQFNKKLSIIRPEAFMGTALSDELIINGNLEKIDYKSFSISEITKLDISNTKVKSFDFDVLYGCDNLKSIILPNNLKYITLTSGFNFNQINNIKFSDKIEQVFTSQIDKTTLKIKKFLEKRIKEKTIGSITVEEIKNIYLNN